ncbi:hypothetical protein ACFL6U_10680 [Planctomycetota bacterium]
MKGKTTILLLTSILIMGFSGCEQWQTSSSRNDNAQSMRVSALSARYRVALTAQDIVAIMRATGFTDRQIYELGPDLRAALMQGGAAHFVMPRKSEKDLIEAVVVVRENDYVHITRRQAGFYIYDARNHQFGLRDADKPDTSRLGLVVPNSNQMP